jgi:hypothetical protein
MNERGVLRDFVPAADRESINTLFCMSEPLMVM